MLPLLLVWPQVDTQSGTLSPIYRFEDVCEDAITFKQKSGSSLVSGGGAKSADDKVLQFNGFGSLTVNGYWRVYAVSFLHCLAEY